jgi:phosphoribosylpyrophosphate synthetase
MILCSKVRKEGRKEIIIQEGEAKESDVLIVDDLIQSGGTLIETARVLRDHGARKVRAFASHGVFP